MMLDQLKKLLEMQRVLDESIFKEHGITEYPLENMKLALFDELGELLHEFPTKYKYWKKTAVDNREKGLEEYVDCLHFALSLTNYSMNNGKWKVNESWEYEKHNHDVLSLFDELNGCVTYIKEPLSFLFAIGNKLGFTWDEIYEAYKRKNEINYKRLKEGY